MLKTWQQKQRSMRQLITWHAQNQHVYTLNLSEGFEPLKSITNIPMMFKKFSFAGGERHFQVLDNPNTQAANSCAVITQRVASTEDIYEILLANDALRRMGFREVHLILPCFPAARQDRVCNKGEPLTVKVNADLINSCGFDSVTIMTPHSDVTTALINNCIVANKDAQYVKSIVDATSNGHVYNVVCPDAGAGKRVFDIVQYLHGEKKWHRFELIRCEKIRDVSNGKLKEIVVHANDLEGATTLIVDDIVVYGGTFLGIAEKLRERNCGKIGIFTTHADCQEGLDKLAEVFDFVYTTNSKRDFKESEKIKIIQIEL